ncbi:hypothetical protein D3C81_1172800 [compost metagenome]
MAWLTQATTSGPSTSMAMPRRADISVVTPGSLCGTLKCMRFCATATIKVLPAVSVSSETMNGE